MHSIRKALVVLCFIFFAISSWAEPVSRISRNIDSRNMVRLGDNVHSMARPEFDQGALDPSQIVHDVMIAFNRTAAQQQELQQLLLEQHNPASPNYHQWLTPEQFAARFGMSDADLAKIKDWLTSQGFTIDEVSRGHSYIAFSGPAGRINSAFQTELHQYNVNGEVHFANATSPALPSALAPVVAGIRSLNNFRPRPRITQRHVKPDFTSSISQNTYIAPDDFATIYNLNALYASGIDGTGQSIAVVGQTDLVLTDIATFRSVSNLPASAPQVVLVSGATDPGVVSNDIGEASLDVEWAGAIARKATIIYVNSGDVFTSLYDAINNNRAPVISISYGACEQDEQPYANADEAELQQASVQGQTVVGPSGDDGAADCDFPTGSQVILSATQGLQVDYPASSQYVTGVGGTAFNEGTGTTYWSATNNISQGSALFYIPEIVWNDTPLGAGLSASGGGASKLFLKPSWQTGTPSDGARDVPDVSFNASPGHDGFITCVQGDCQVCVTTDANCASASSPGYRRSSDQSLDISGGTSAGVPTFAGIVALLNQKMGSRQGNINPKLYQLASTAPYVFHDIVSGDNKVPCNSGTTDCGSSGSFGYSAHPGYDEASGLGSVDAFNMLANWNTTAAADFGLTFFNPTIAVTHGTTGTVLLSVRKQNGFVGTVNLSCSSAIAGVTCSVNPSFVNPDATATVTITASSSASLRGPGHGGPLMPWWTSAFGVAALFGMGSKKRSKLQMLLMAAVLAVLMIALASCGGGGGSGGTKTTGGGGGGGTSGNVTLTATSGSLSHSTNISVTVN